MESNLNVHFVDFVLTFLAVYLKGRENLSLFLLLPKLEHESCFFWLSKGFRKVSDFTFSRYIKKKCMFSLENILYTVQSQVGQ